MRVCLFLEHTKLRRTEASVGSGSYDPVLTAELKAANPNQFKQLKGHTMNSEVLYSDVFGDSLLYAGMLVAVGDTEQQGYVDACIDSNGRIWRNVLAANRNTDYRNSNSRDMFIGALLGASQLSKIRIARYLASNNGLLSPTASDNRNRVGVMGWAQLGLALGKDATVAHMGLKGFILAKIFKPLLGFIAFVEAVTVYEPYQLNLVCCALMLFRKHGVDNYWTRETMRTLENVRNQNDVVFLYLKGAKERVEGIAGTAADNRNSMLTLNKYGEAAGWPPSSGGHFAHIYPSAVYVRWSEMAFKNMK